MTLLEFPHVSSCNESPGHLKYPRPRKEAAYALELVSKGVDLDVPCGVPLLRHFRTYSTRSVCGFPWSFFSRMHPQNLAVRGFPVHREQDGDLHFICHQIGSYIFLSISQPVFVMFVDHGVSRGAVARIVAGVPGVVNGGLLGDAAAAGFVGGVVHGVVEQVAVLFSVAGVVHRVSCVAVARIVAGVVHGGLLGAWDAAAAGFVEDGATRSPIVLFMRSIKVICFLIFINLVLTYSSLLDEDEDEDRIVPCARRRR